MSLIRILLCIFIPPLAVLDDGIGAILITLLLCCLGWIPGVIAAFYFNSKRSVRTV